MNVLLVEDEQRVADFVQRGLRAEGWAVTATGDGESALDLLARDSYDVVVLDLMLPGIGGQDVCKRMRARCDHTPVLMLTALDRTDDRVDGLKAGADDYLGKPFDFEELLARLEALVRRATKFDPGSSPSTALVHGALHYDTRTLEVRCGDQRLDLSAKEREILKLLLTDAGRVYSRERILNAAWGTTSDPLTNVVDVYISRLRKKLGDAVGIETVRGAGYRLASVPET